MKFEKRNPIIFIIIISFLSFSCLNKSPQEFYVDPQKGNDNYSGNIEKPFKTVDKALSTVQERVEKGICSDKIFLRGGVYRKTSDITLYHLELKGTPDNYALISAMTCDSTMPGAVKRKSGQWYENVIFDDAWLIETPWESTNAERTIWETSPGYTHLEWTHRNLWPWTLFGYPISDNDSTPETTSFTVAPYMLLQDGEPSIWVNSLNELTEEGQHFYDQTSKTLYFYPYSQKDPNTCKIETWYGGDENYEIGTLHLDGEGRALFDGNLQYAAIKGFGFRMFNKLFELHRRKYNTEEERVIQRDVLFEDNYCEYGWIQILLDANTVIDSMPGVIRPKYEDRARWIVRNNIFYRPSREVCQLHGDDHLFEGNVVIDHIGPWAGPAAIVSSVNTRNTRNFTVRNNYFIGQGNTKYSSGSVFMIESGYEHADENGDYIFGGQTYENNIIANVTSGAVFVLGKGGARMRDITIKNNIIKTNETSPAILMGSPQKNLKITGNIFYDQTKILKVTKFHTELNFDSLASTISISGNMFVYNASLIDMKALNSHHKSNIEIQDNLFYENNDEPIGEKIILKDPMFTDPDLFNFTSMGNTDSVIFNGKTNWSLFRDIFPSELQR